MESLDVKEEVEESAEQIVCTPTSGEVRGRQECNAICDVCKHPIPKARIHYGGITCYSCRAFFRRAVQRGVDDVCRREGNCPISNNDRKQCPNCRMKQCLRIGMQPKLVLNDEEKEVRFRKKNHNPAGAGSSPTPSQQQSPRSASASGQPRQKKKSKKVTGQQAGQLAGQPPPADSVSSRLAEFPGPSGMQGRGFGLEQGRTPSIDTRLVDNRIHSDDIKTETADYFPNLPPYHHQGIPMGHSGGLPMGGTLPHPCVPHQSMDIKHEDPLEAAPLHAPPPGEFIPDSWQPRLTAHARVETLRKLESILGSRPSTDHPIVGPNKPYLDLPGLPAGLPPTQQSTLLPDHSLLPHSVTADVLNEMPIIKHEVSPPRPSMFSDKSRLNNNLGISPEQIMNNFGAQIAAAAIINNKFPFENRQSSPLRTPSPSLDFDHVAELQQQSPQQVTFGNSPLTARNIPAMKAENEELYRRGRRSVLYNSFESSYPLDCRSQSPKPRRFSGNQSSQPQLMETPRLPEMPPVEMPPATNPLQIDKQVQMKRFKLENPEGGFTTVYQQVHGKDTSMDGVYSMAGSKAAFCSTTNGVDGSIHQEMVTKSAHGALNSPIKNVLNTPPSYSDTIESFLSSPCSFTTNSQVESIEKAVIVDNTKMRNSPQQQGQSSVRVSVINFTSKRTIDDCDNSTDNATNINESAESVINCNNKVNDEESDKASLIQTKTGYNNDENQKNTTDNYQLQSFMPKEQSEREIRERFRVENMRNLPIIRFCQSIFDPMNFESIISEEIKYRHKKLRMHSSSVQHMFNDMQDQDGENYGDQSTDSESVTSSPTCGYYSDNNQQHSLVVYNSESGSFELDDQALLDTVLKMDISFLEELYTSEEKNYINLQNSVFWNNWKSVNLGLDHWQEFAECKKLGKFSDNIFYSGYKQLAIKCIKYLSEGPFVNSYDADFEALLRANIKPIMNCFTLWNNIFSPDDQFQNVIGSSDEFWCQQLNLLPFRGVRDMYEQHPVLRSNTTIFKILDSARSCCGLLRDVNVLKFLLTLQFCDVGPDISLRDWHFLNNTLKETRTQLRRYLMTKYDSRKADEAYRQVMNFLKFNKFFNESLMTPVPMKN